MGYRFEVDNLWGSRRGLKHRGAPVGSIWAEFQFKHSHGDPFRDFCEARSSLVLTNYYVVLTNYYLVPTNYYLVQATYYLVQINHFFVPHQ